jgi:protein-arginine kinase
MEHSKIHYPPFDEHDDAMIISTRIRVARNLAGYPLGPALTKE